LFTIGATLFVITYQGGDGNDVQLVVPGTKVWSGQGANADWSNGTNWVGNVAPVPADDLVFPGGAARTFNTNDFVTGTLFNSITISNGAYTLSGNSITLSAGFTNTGPLATATINCPLMLANDQTFDCCCQQQLTFTGPIDTAGSTLTFVGNGRFHMNGVISGSGGLYLNDSGGGVFLAGANTYTGPTTVADGALIPNNDSALGNSSTGTTILPSGLLEFVNVNVSLAEPITLQSQIQNFTGTNVLTGDVTLLSGASILVQTNSTLILSNILSGTNALVKNGTGTLLLNGDESGRPVTLNAGILGGIGTAGPLTVRGGKLSPGASAGILNVNGDVTLTNLATFILELNGTNAGMGYDQLNVAGGVNLANCALNVSLGFVPPSGTTFVVINNDGSDAISNTFAGLPEGAVFSINGLPFQISYAGGSGNNDVVLTRASPPALIDSIGSTTNGFELLQGSGFSNLTYTIQANTNLSTTNWSTIGSATANGSGLFSFTDTNAPSFPIRFYRLLSP
jgi:autotransporter-associated beta strand protein